jgi:hypothetical protein
VSVKVTVALAGPAMAPPFRPLEQPDVPDGGWGERRRVTLDVKAETLLGDLIDLAAGQLGVHLDPTATDARSVSRELQGVAFDQPGAPYPRIVSELTLVNADGQASWGHWWAEVPYGELVRAADAGLVAGDISRLYLRPTPPAGAFGGIDEWRQFLNHLELLGKVIEELATVYASAAALTAAAQRVRRGIEAVRRNWQRWHQRGGTPDRVDLMLTQHDWSTPEIAELLGTDPRTAEAVLELFGLAPDRATGRWRLRGDELAALLAGNMQLLRWDRITFGTTAAAAEARLRELLANRTLRFVKHGVPPSAPDYRQITQGEWHPPA